MGKHQGGTRAAAFQTLVEVLEEAAANITRYKFWEMYSVPVYDRYKKTFSNIAVLDSMGPTDQSVRFFCDVANAPQMCAHVRGQTFPRTNSHVNIDHYDVASAAVRKGLVKVPNACLDAVGQAFLSQGAGELPRKCISKEAQDSLKSWSLDAEKKFFPDRDGSELLAQFDHALKGSLCSVDTDSLLAQPTWREFFANLSPPLC